MTIAVLVVGALLVLLAGWLRAAGAAVGHIPRADALRDASDGVAGASQVADLLDNREIISPAVGVVASGLLVMGAALAAASLATMASASGALVVAAGTALIVFLIGDLAPRRLGAIKPGLVAYRSHGLLRFAVRLGGWANDLIPETEQDDQDSSQEEEAEADEHERVLIDSVLEFGETIVREVMTPRPDMVTIPATGTIEELVEVSTGVGYSRIPVVSEGDVVGIVIVKDLLKLLTDEEPPASVAQVMRPAEFIPETKLAAALLTEMQESHIHQMIVVDEYGDVAGLVTIEDLLEELVGEIADETDIEEELIARDGPGWWVDARLPLDDFCDIVGIDVPDFDGDTMGGFVLDLAERVPEVGEVFEHGPLAITVTRVQGRRIAELVVTVAEPIESS